MSAAENGCRLGIALQLPRRPPIDHNGRRRPED
jgi:hypothetical protein